MILYGPQKYTAGTFSSPHYFRTAAAGGGDPGIAAFPEIVSGEAVKTVDGAGPNGERVLDVDTSGGEEPIDAGIAVVLPTPIDIANGVVIEWDQKLQYGDASANPYPVLLTLTMPDNPYSSYDFSLAFSFDSNPTFNYWELGRELFSAGAFYTDSAPTTLTQDGAWHKFKLVLRPGTSSNNYATVNFDGYWRLYVDGVLTFSEENVDLILLPNSGTPNVIGGYWLGYFGLIGQVTNLTFSTLTSPTVFFNQSLGECRDVNNPPASQTSTGDLTPPVYTSWERQCGGDGVVPSASDVPDDEDWRA